MTKEPNENMDYHFCDNYNHLISGADLRSSSSRNNRRKGPIRHKAKSNLIIASTREKEPKPLLKLKLVSLSLPHNLNHQGITGSKLISTNTTSSGQEFEMASTHFNEILLLGNAGANAKTHKSAKLASLISLVPVYHNPQHQHVTSKNRIQMQNSNIANFHHWYQFTSRKGVHRLSYARSVHTVRPRTPKLRNCNTLTQNHKI